MFELVLCFPKHNLYNFSSQYFIDTTIFLYHLTFFASPHLRKFKIKPWFGGMAKESKDLKIVVDVTRKETLKSKAYARHASVEY